MSGKKEHVKEFSLGNSMRFCGLCEVPRLPFDLQLENTFDLNDLLTKGESIAFVCPQGIFRTAYVRSILSKLSENHKIFQFLRPPDLDDIHALSEWSIKQDEKTLILIDEVADTKGRRDSQSIEKILWHLPQWYNNQKIQFFLALSPEAYSNIEGTLSSCFFINFRERKINSLPKDECETILNSLLRNELSEQQKDDFNKVFETFSKESKLTVECLEASYKLIRKKQNTVNVIEAIEGLLAERIIVNLNEHELVILGFCQQIQKLCGVCPKSSLEYFYKKNGFETFDYIIGCMHKQHFICNDNHPVHDVVLRSNINIPERFYSHMIPGYNQLIEQLVKYMEEIADNVRGSVKQDRVISPANLQKFISACHLVLEGGKRLPRFFSLLCYEPYKFPKVSAARARYSEQKLQIAVDETYNEILRLLCNVKEIHEFKGICFEIEEFVYFYKSLLEQHLPLSRSFINLSHEIAQYSTRWIKENTHESDDPATLAEVKDIIKGFHRNSAYLHEKCADLIETKEEYFSAGMLWRTSAYDYMLIGDYATALKCFTKAGDNFLKNKKTILLAAECYGAFGDVSTLSVKNGLKNFFKSMLLRFLIQKDSSKDWQKEFEAIKMQKKTADIEREFDAAKRELCEISEEFKVLVSEDYLLNNILTKKNITEGDKVSKDILIISDYYEEYLADYIFIKVSRILSLKTQHITPLDFLRQLESSPSLLVKYSYVFILGGLKVPGISAIQKLCLPDAKNISASLAPHETHKTFLWSYPANDNNPFILWIAGSGLEATYEGVWHVFSKTDFMNTCMSGLVDGHEVAHLNEKVVSLRDISKLINNSSAPIIQSIENSSVIDYKKESIPVDIDTQNCLIYLQPNENLLILYNYSKSRKKPAYIIKVDSGKERIWQVLIYIMRKYTKQSSSATDMLGDKLFITNEELKDAAKSKNDNAFSSFLYIFNNIIHFSCKNKLIERVSSKKGFIVNCPILEKTESIYSEKDGPGSVLLSHEFWGDLPDNADKRPR